MINSPACVCKISPLHNCYLAAPAGSPGYHGDVPPSYYDNEEFAGSGFEDKNIRQAFIRKVSEILQGNNKTKKKTTAHFSS